MPFFYVHSRQLLFRTPSLMLAQIVQSLFGTRDIASVPVDTLRGLASRFPYSSPLYLLYIKRKYFCSTVSAVLPVKDKQLRDSELSHLYLLFDNPFWIHVLLGDDRAPGLHKRASLPPPAAVEDEDNEDDDVVSWPGHAGVPFEDIPARRVGVTRKTTSTARKPAAKTSKGVARLKDFIEDHADAVPFSVPPKSTRKTAARGGGRARAAAAASSADPQAKQTPKSARPTVRSRQSAVQRSFSDWLKNAKKIPGSAGTHFVQETPKAPSRYTQTMATLYERQGNLEQALLVYENLCALYPEKWAQFEKKMGDLKKRISKK